MAFYQILEKTAISPAWIQTHAQKDNIPTNGSLTCTPTLLKSSICDRKAPPPPPPRLGEVQTKYIRIRMYPSPARLCTSLQAQTARARSALSVHLAVFLTKTLLYMSFISLHLSHRSSNFFSYSPTNACMLEDC